MPLYRKRPMRMRRRRFKRKRRTLRLGQSPRTKSHTKSYEENNTAILNKAFGRQHTVEIFDLEKASSLANTNNRRLTDRVMIKGIRLQKYFENASTVDPIVVNVALVTVKSAAPAETNWGDNGSNWPTGFFRQYGANIREAAFDQSALSAFEINSLPINSDRFEVHKRWTKVLQPKPAATAGDTRPSNYHRWIINKYIPINRVVNYQDTHDHAHDSRTFIVYWSDLQQRNAGTLLTGLGVTHSSRIVTFFRDKGL